MRKSLEFFQADDSHLTQERPTELGVSLKEKKERILKRAVLEILPNLVPWSERKSAITQMTIRETLKRHSLYENAPPSQWRGVLEEFVEKDIEILILNKEFQTKDLLKLGNNRKHPLIERLEELEETKNETLLLLWHPENGLLACTEKELPKSFPNLHTKLRFQTPHQNREYILWLWDRKNFSPNE
jgi:hypothetical protein